MVSEAWTLFLQGKVLEALIATYTDVMGFWFFIIIYAMVIVMIYLKTETTTTPLIVSLVITGIMLYLAPAGATGLSEMQMVSIGLFGLSVAGLAAVIYKGR